MQDGAPTFPVREDNLLRTYYLDLSTEELASKEAFWAVSLIG